MRYNLVNKLIIVIISTLAIGLASNDIKLDNNPNADVKSQANTISEWLLVEADLDINSSEGSNEYASDGRDCVDVTFTLSDAYDDGFEGSLTFDGNSMTVDYGGNPGIYTFCLDDGDYTYTYSCSNYCGEHSWTISTEADGVLASGGGSDGLTDYSFTIGGVVGCTDATANNYDPSATVDNGTCSYPGGVCSDPISLTLPIADQAGTTSGSGDDYSFSPCSSSYMSGDDQVFSFTIEEDGLLSGSAISTNGYSYPAVHILTDCPDNNDGYYYVNTCVAIGGGSQGGSFVDAAISAGTYFAVVSNYASPQSTDYLLSLSWSAPPEVLGCLDANANNYNADANTQDYDANNNSSCTYDSCNDAPGSGAGLCLWDTGQAAAWWDGPWNCAENGGVACGKAVVEYTLSLPSDISGTPYVNGTMNGWCGNCNPMSANDDGSYSLTHYLDPATQYEYKFTVNGWDIAETVPTDCGVSTTDEGTGEVFTNRGYTTGDGETTATEEYCFGTCDVVCAGQTQTFAVDFSGIIASAECAGQVNITGTFDGWSGWGLNPDDGYTATLADGDYEFIGLCVDTSIDGWWNDVWSNSTLLKQCDDTNFSFTVAGSDLTLDTDLTPYAEGACDCAGSIEDCAGECGGDAWSSDCGCVAADNSGDDCDDCAGTPNGTAASDYCGVCDGTNSAAYEQTDCVNDDSTGDAYGDTCSSWYDAFGGCGDYDTDDFNSATQCCACGGGDSQVVSYPASGPDVGCDGVCFSGLVNDECGVCDGSGFAEGTCDCEGNVDIGAGCGLLFDCGENMAFHPSWFEVYGGDGVCHNGDDPDSIYGLNFACEDYSCDGGDCAGACGCNDDTSCLDCCGVADGDDSSCAGLGDADGNGSVDVNDVVTMIAHILVQTTLEGCSLNEGDITNDGYVNVMDVIAAVDVILSGVVYGCLDEQADNYNTDATDTDDSCEYCSDCANDYTANGSECCDTAWGAFGLNCEALQGDYNWDCSGCDCPGDAETSCGDGTCDWNEDADSCAADCAGTCANECCSWQDCAEDGSEYCYGNSAGTYGYCWSSASCCYYTDQVAQDGNAFGSTDNCPQDCSALDNNDDGLVNIKDLVMGQGDHVKKTALKQHESVQSLDQPNVILERKVKTQFKSVLKKAETVKLIQNEEGLSIESNGYVGLEITLSHSNDFEINLTNAAFISDYETTGNQTKLVVVGLETSEVFSSTGDFEIVEAIVGTTDGVVLNADIISIPSEFGISNAYPNPFNPSTSVELAMPSDGFVSVKVFNLNGQIVATLHEGNLTANSYSFAWDAANMASGLYLLKAETAGNVDVQKIMLMK
jgi:hypothetical protein